MQITIVKELKQKVFVANEVPDECVAHAQVAIISNLSWHLIAPNPYRAHGMSEALPLPKVACPIVDVRSVTDDEAMMKVMSACVDKTAGVINLSGLLTGLEALGAVVTQKPVLTAAEVTQRFLERKNKRVAMRGRARVRVN
jgi:hypothetical protein